MSRRPPKGTRGFTMVEVLVAVLTTAIGALAIAALQITSKRANFETSQRTTAIGLANDIIERMRGNVEQIAVYTNAGAGTNLTGNLSAPNPNCDNAVCTAAQLAAYDLFKWDQALLGVAESNNSGGLAAPTGCITQGVAPNFVTVAIAWRGATALSNPQSSASVDRTCGQGSGLYDDSTGDEAFRQVLVVPTFLN